MNNVYKLTDYTFAKKMIKELPPLINKIEVFTKQLDMYKHQWPIVDLQNALIRANNNLQFEYAHYRHVYNQKGNK